MSIMIASRRVVIPRPAEGWFPLPLLAAMVGLVVAAVLEVGWVAEDGVVLPAATAGFVLPVMLAKRPLRPFFAWLLLLPYAALIPVLSLAGLFSWPPLGAGIWVARQFWLQRGGLFLDRFGSWWVAVFGGGSSDETIVFAYLLGLLAFLLPAAAVWTSLRRRPLPGLTMLGIALAVNSYFGDIGAGWIAVYIGLTLFLTAQIHFADLEQQWERSAVDYSEEIRVELAIYTAAMALLLISISFLLPAFSIRNIQEWMQRQTAVNQVEDEFGRAFAGVEQPRARPPSPGGVGGAGTLPRSYLLDAPPELLETVMMTATISLVQEGALVSAPETVLRGAHWRALSYDVYTGRGWAISEERRENFTAGAMLPLPEESRYTTLQQQVFWQADERVIRYSLGRPLRFDQDVIAAWRGISDLARVWGAGNVYTVDSVLPAVTETQLRAAPLDQVPPAVLARYTILPDSVPPQVHDLAQEVAGELASPYAQARALEQFLRQYPYSLEVSAPPPDVDPVAFFLFEQQAGYCDYYASAMVVMARSLGLPARIGVGYLAPPPDENGVQLILQENGHSWAEVYFAGIGWVEFEPTAAFSSPRDRFVGGSGEVEPAAPPPPPPPLPESRLVRPFPWSRVLLLGVPVLLLLFVWQRRRWRDRRQRLADPTGYAYGRLQQGAQRLGYPISPTETPAEFAAGFSDWLPEQQRPRLLLREEGAALSAVQELAALFAAVRYAAYGGGGVRAAALWRRLQHLLRPLQIWQFLRRRLFSLRKG